MTAKVRTVATGREGLGPHRPRRSPAASTPGRWPWASWLLSWSLSLLIFEIGAMSDVQLAQGPDVTISEPWKNSVNGGTIIVHRYQRALFFNRICFSAMKRRPAFVVPQINVPIRTSSEYLAKGPPLPADGRPPRSDEMEGFNSQDYEGRPRRTIWPSLAPIVLRDQRPSCEILT